MSDHDAHTHDHDHDHHHHHHHHDGAHGGNGTHAHDKPKKSPKPHTHDKPPAHVHGPGCGHDHAHERKPIFPKGKRLPWVIAGVGAAAGAVAINALGRGASEGESRQRDKERGKTESERAGDIAYTINHALSCGTTDMVLQPVIAAAFGVNIGCGHGSTRKGKIHWGDFAHEAAHYFKGEIFGDLVAVPATIAVQRFFPDFMHGVRRIIEPVAGGAFRFGAGIAARDWGRKNGFAENSPEVAARKEAIYEHEVAHLPQAVVWNMFAYPIGAIAQVKTGHQRPLNEVLKSKLIGGIVSNSILIGGRMLAPGAAQKWDAVIGDNIFMPVTRGVGKVLGIDPATMDEAARREKQGVEAHWQERLRREPATEATREVA